MTVRRAGQDPSRVEGASIEPVADGASREVTSEVQEVANPNAKRTDRPGSAGIQSSAIQARLEAALAAREKAAAPANETLAKLETGEFTPNAKAAYDQITKLLSTSATDWAVTDGDTSKILDLLDKLSDKEWQGAICEMRKSGHFATFVERGLKDDNDLLIRFHEQTADKLGIVRSDFLHIGEAFEAMGVPEPKWGGIEPPQFAKDIFNAINPFVH